MDPNAAKRKARNDASDCFIATTVFESSFAPEVVFFKAWRNDVLSKHWIGKLIIKIYYVVGPNLANIVSKNYFLKIFAIKLLRKLIIIINLEKSFTGRYKS